PPAVADDMAAALKVSEADREHCRQTALQQIDRRRRVVVSKLDRGYDDSVSGKISEEFWNRKSQEWEAEIQAIDAERGRLEHPSAELMITAQKILGLAKKAEFLYKTQDPTEQRRLLENVLSNCTFDRGSLCPAYNKQFDLFVEENKTGNWRRGWDSNPRAPY